MEFITFKIYLDYPKKFKKYYYKVCIFKSRKSMYSYRDSLNKDGASFMKKPHQYLACCSSYHDKKNPKQFGVLLFYKGSDKKVGIVSHELTHAVTYWWKSIFDKNKKMRNIYDNKKADEQYAWVLGNLAHQYWVTWYDIQDKKRDFDPMSKEEKKYYKNL